MASFKATSTATTLLKSNPFTRIAAKALEAKVDDDRLAILAVELGLAGAEVLQEDFGFTQEQTAKWLDVMLSKAKTNRAVSLARMAVEQIDNDPKGS